MGHNHERGGRTIEENANWQSFDIIQVGKAKVPEKLGFDGRHE